MSSAERTVPLGCQIHVSAPFAVTGARFIRAEIPAWRFRLGLDFDLNLDPDPGTRIRPMILGEWRLDKPHLYVSPRLRRCSGQARAEPHDRIQALGDKAARREPRFLALAQPTPEVSRRMLVQAKDQSWHRRTWFWSPEA
jgi:hypothetical protein